MKPAAPVTSFGPAPSRRRARTRLGRHIEGGIAAALAPLAMLVAALAMVMASALMPTPGTLITTSSRPGPSRFVRAPGATLFIVGQAERGSTTQAMEITSLPTGRSRLGGRVTYGSLDDHLAVWFAEAGGRAQVARVAGPAATAGFLTLQDAAAGPVNTLKVWANSVGAWSSRVTVQVLAGSLPTTFRLKITLDGVTEDWDNLQSPAHAVQVLNPTADNPGSQWVTLTDMNSASAAPTNNPAVLAATALSAGVDDRAAITAQHYIDALARFGPNLGDGVVIIPGQTATNMAAGIKAHCKANSRIGLLAPASGQTVAQVKATAITLRGNAAGEDGVGLVFPHVYMPDGAGGRRLISPESYAAAARARAHQQEGPWRSPGGPISTASFIAGLELEMTEAEMEDVCAQHVIPIMNFGEDGIQLYDWRSLSTDEANFELLTSRDVLNRLSVGIRLRTNRLVHQTIDGTNPGNSKFLAKLETEILAEVKPMARAGGLFPGYENGVLVDPGYKIDTGEGVNSVATLQANQAWADVEVRPSPTARSIRVNITRVGVGTAL